MSTCIGAILLLTSKKYKKKILKCCELIDKITISLATSEVLIILSLNDDIIIDAKKFHKLQAVYLQMMADVRNVDRKMKVQTEDNFQKLFWTKKEFRKRYGTKIVGLGFCMLFNCIYYENNEE